MADLEMRGTTRDARLAKAALITSKEARNALLGETELEKSTFKKSRLAAERLR
jgi:hypothetical protein